MSEPLKNWAGNVAYRATQTVAPETVAQAQEHIRRNERIKALGSRHSFNDIADTTAVHLSMAQFDRILTLDRERATVTIEGGARYGELCRYLHREGYALHNLASLPHISVAGACATATHGSGTRNGNLATVVSALELITGEGELVALSRERDGETFQGAVVGLGALGVVTKLTLDLIPTFAVRQDVYENLPMERLEAHFEAIMSGGYSVSLFTDWRSERINQVWRKSRVEEGAPFTAEPVWFGATQATRPLHPLAEFPAEPCTEQLGVPGPWHDRLPHFRMEFTPSFGEELQSEYFVPYDRAVPVLRALYALREQIAPHLLISEIRAIAADSLWMSPCYQQACLGVHFTWKKDWESVQRVLPQIEAQLAPFHAKLHWGKLFTIDAATLASRYPKLPDFRRLRSAFDPQGKFCNAFLERCLSLD